jgi:membrane-associated protease RseP (regulator of RpoE activity)
MEPDAVPPAGPWSSPPRPKPALPWAPALLFVATVATTVVAGAAAGDSWDGDLSRFGAGAALSGLPYAAAILAILAAHELGHYVLARGWGVETTLPYFIPGIPPVGTFGAVIRMRSAIPSRRAVLDIGAAGPIGGLLVAIPLLVWGTAHSEYRPFGDAFLETGPGGGLWQLALGWLRGSATPIAAGMHFGDSLLTAGMQRLVLGPLPAGHEMVPHPVFMAAWFGLFVTTLNLLPIGQLDGGHVLYALLGRRGALWVSRATSWGLFAAGLFVSWNWLLWWAITRFAVRLGHPAALDERPLDGPRIAVALLSLLLFALTFIPVPVAM